MKAIVYSRIKNCNWKFKQIKTKLDFLQLILHCISDFKNKEINLQDLNHVLYDLGLEKVFEQERIKRNLKKLKNT